MKTVLHEKNGEFIHMYLEFYCKGHDNYRHSQGKARKAGLDETLVLVSKLPKNCSRFLVSVLSQSQNIIFQNSRSRPDLEKSFFRILGIVLFLGILFRKLRKNIDPSDNGRYALSASLVQLTHLLDDDLLAGQIMPVWIKKFNQVMNEVG